MIKSILYYIFLYPLICLKNALDPNWWASLIGNKTGLYEKAHKGKLAQWSRSLTGWKWWAWQIVGGIIALTLFEWILNQLGMTLLPWR